MAYVENLLVRPAGKCSFRICDIPGYPPYPYLNNSYRSRAQVLRAILEAIPPSTTDIMADVENLLVWPAANSFFRLCYIPGYPPLHLLTNSYGVRT